MHRIAIKIEGIERRKKSTGLFHIIAGLFLIANTSEYYKESGYQNFFTVLPIYFIAAASLFYGLLRNKIDPTAQFNHWMRMLQFLMFTLLGVLFLKSDLDFRNILLLLWAVICILLLFTERKVFHDAVLNFGKNSITIPGYFSNKVIPWEAIENIVVRQDFVTIYYPQNRYIQYEVQAELNEVQINTINQFCQQQIHPKNTMHQV
jgi:hypothetical protein